MYTMSYGMTIRKGQKSIMIAKNKTKAQLQRCEVSQVGQENVEGAQEYM